MRRAVLLDALGTLVELPPPAPALVEELANRGVTISLDEADAAMRAEIAHYRAHLGDGRDAASLQALRARCTEVLREALPAHARDVSDLQEVLLGALRFRPYPEVPEALAGLRAAGARLVVVSNWDASLHEVLERTGLAPLVDGLVTSAEHGAAKPDPSIFHAALRLAGATPLEALHCGDSPEADVAGARAAGIEPVLVVRDGEPPADGTRSVTSLSSLVPALSSSTPTWEISPERPEPPPSSGGERPKVGERAWPWWIGPLALITVLVVASIAGAIALIATGSTDNVDDAPPGALMAATFIQGLAFIGAAILFARMFGRVSADSFGLRPAHIWRAVGLIVAVYVVFVVFAGIWSQIIDLGETEDQLENLGVDESDAALVFGALLVCVCAPIVEEFFFRGFFFASMRNATGPWIAAVITGLVFGAIHFGSADAGALVPLAVFGLGLCLLYEWTGSLYPCIALHAINNSLAFGFAVDWGWEVPLLTLGSLLAVFAITVPLAGRWRSITPLST